MGLGGWFPGFDRGRRPRDGSFGILRAQRLRRRARRPRGAARPIPSGLILGSDRTDSAQLAPETVAKFMAIFQCGVASRHAHVRVNWPSVSTIRVKQDEPI